MTLHVHIRRLEPLHVRGSCVHTRPQHFVPSLEEAGRTGGLGLGAVSIKRQYKGREDRLDCLLPTDRAWAMGPPCRQALVPQRFGSTPQGYGLGRREQVPWDHSFT